MDYSQGKLMIYFIPGSLQTCLLVLYYGYKVQFYNLITLKSPVGVPTGLLISG